MLPSVSHPPSSLLPLFPPPSCCIYCTQFISLPAAVAPHCCPHFILPKLIFSTLSGLVCDSQACVITCACICVYFCVFFCCNGHVVCVCACFVRAACWISFLWVCQMCTVVADTFLTICALSVLMHIAMIVCVCVCVCACVCGGLFICLSSPYLSLFVPSSVQFSKWENLDCILSGLYWLLHFLCVCVCCCAFASIVELLCRDLSLHITVSPVKSQPTDWAVVDPSSKGQLLIGGFWMDLWMIAGVYFNMFIWYMN